MKRRDFIKGLVAAPVVAKIGVEAVAKPKDGVALFSQVHPKPNSTFYPMGDMSLSEASLEDAMVDMADMKGVFGWSNP